jgi:hypothetical protein
MHGVYGPGPGCVPFGLLFEADVATILFGGVMVAKATLLFGIVISCGSFGSINVMMPSGIGVTLKSCDFSLISKTPFSTSLHQQGLDLARVSSGVGEPGFRMSGFVCMSGFVVIIFAKGTEKSKSI